MMAKYLIWKKFSHWKMKPAPTQDKFLDFFQNEFSHSACFQKAFFIWMGGKRFALARARMGTLPHSNEKKAFWKHFECENSFCKKSRNLSWVGAGFSFQWLNFSKNAWNFAFFEIWSGCRCDMKIIFDVFDNLDATLLSNEIFWCWHAQAFDSGSVYFISECQGHAKMKITSIAIV